MTKEKTLCPNCQSQGWINYDTNKVQLKGKKLQCEKCQTEF